MDARIAAHRLSRAEKVIDLLVERNGPWIFLEGRSPRGDVRLDVAERDLFRRCDVRRRRDFERARRCRAKRRLGKVAARRESPTVAREDANADRAIDSRCQRVDLTIAYADVLDVGGCESDIAVTQQRALERAKNVLELLARN